MAAVRQMYAREMKATTFFDSSIVAIARTVCLMKPEKLRVKKENGPPATVKLPICEGIIADMRVGVTRTSALNHRRLNFN
jgi:hypothetical protein